MLQVRKVSFHFVGVGSVLCVLWLNDDFDFINILRAALCIEI